MKYADVQRGFVENIFELEPKNAKVFPTAVPSEVAAIGDGPESNSAGESRFGARAGWTDT